MKFNNLNLGSDKKSEFTKADVKSTEMKESKDQMNYALDQPDPVRLAVCILAGCGLMITGMELQNAIISIRCLMEHEENYIRVQKLLMDIR